MKDLSGLIVRGIVASIMLIMAATVAFAQEKQPMTPEKAATAERVRKQKEQIPTHEQRKTAADSLKAERLKIYKARQEAGTAGKEKKRGEHGENKDGQKSSK